MFQFNILVFELLEYTSSCTCSGRAPERQSAVYSVALYRTYLMIVCPLFRSLSWKLTVSHTFFDSLLYATFVTFFHASLCICSVKYCCFFAPIKPAVMYCLAAFVSVTRSVRCVTVLT